ncbi:MAG: efflux RND transporter periplasmic adaptor subunit [Candidatus Jidaibacter sp.]|jgi:membrane fusion protein (multidrug efflux system)|nr:efflux RND transporter periplasmic adaptor subunit [Candidatus Jidaibacter sp.]
MNTEYLLEKLKTNKIAVIIISVLLGVIFAVIHLEHKAANSPKAKPPAMVSIAIAQPVDIPMVFNFSGDTIHSKVVEVRPRVSGVLEKILFVEGDDIKEGVPLFQIESEKYKIALRNAEAGMAKAEAQLEQAVRDESRLKKLIQKNAISQKDYDDSLSRLELAMAGVDSAKTAVEEAQINLQYTNIYAPASGIISKTNQNEGSLISATGDNVLTKITQLDPIYVNFSMSEADFIKMKQDVAKGLLKLPPGELLPVDMYYGNGIKFDQVGRLNFADAEFGKGSGVMNIRATFANPGNKIIAGQFVRLVLRGGMRPNALVIPKRAVMESTAGKQVFIINEANEAELRAVIEGPKFKDFVQVVSGISAGDKVVIDGFLKLQPGDKVNITSTVEESPVIEELNSDQENNQISKS